MKEGLRGENKEKEISQILRGRSFICVGVTSEQSMMGNYKWFEDRLIVQFLSFALLWSKFLWSLPISSKVCHIGYLCELGFYFFAFLVRCVLCVCVKMKDNTISMSGLIWYRMKTAHRDYHMVHIYNIFSRMRAYTQEEILLGKSHKSLAGRMAVQESWYCWNQRKKKIRVTLALLASSRSLSIHQTCRFWRNTE